MSKSKMFKNIAEELTLAGKEANPTVVIAKTAVFVVAMAEVMAKFFEEEEQHENEECNCIVCVLRRGIEGAVERREDFSPSEFKVTKDGNIESKPEISSYFQIDLGMLINNLIKLYENIPPTPSQLLKEMSFAKADIILIEERLKAIISQNN